MKLTIQLIVILLLSFTTRVAGEEITNWSGIVVHHSDSPGWTTVSNINAWHIERDFDEIGYHYVIYTNGVVKTGRSIKKHGAHAKATKWKKNRNRTHIGICLVGTDSFTEAQHESLTNAIRVLSHKFPIKIIEPHHKECPGHGVDVKKLNKILK